MAKGLFDNILGNKKSESEEYKAGYEAAEKKYKRLQAERDVAVNQIKSLGYELGEKPDPVRSASMVKKYCKSQMNCNTCAFNSDSGCILSGDNPSEWRIM